MALFKYFLPVLLFVNLLSCGKEKSFHPDVSHIEAKAEVIRFDKKFYESSADNLPKLKQEFPFLFPESEPDSVWIAKMKDEDELFLYNSTQQVYGDFGNEKEALTELFKHVKYYFPKFGEPEVITILTNVDFNHKVVYADSLLFIALDNFLGKDHEVYLDYPNYLKQNFTKDQLIVEVSKQLVNPVIGPPRSSSFVSRMVQEGKKLKLEEAFLPDLQKNVIMGYSEEQYQWAEANESFIWKYFIEKELLFSNDIDLSERFIEEAPFSKFYLEIDKESPGRIGAWFGWQIVDSFMEHNDVDIQEMVTMDNEEIFKRSKYKPKKR
jgi:gliding motility-associated lipoprotein GldB